MDKVSIRHLTMLPDPEIMEIRSESPDRNEFLSVMRKKMANSEIQRDEIKYLSAEYRPAATIIWPEFHLDEVSEPTISVIQIVDIARTHGATNFAEMDCSMMTVRITQTITELASAYDHILVKSTQNSENQWQFVYLDSLLNQINLTIQKTGHYHLTISYASAQLQQKQLNLLIRQLHNQLLEQGWISKIKQANDHTPLTSISPG